MDEKDYNSEFIPEYFAWVNMEEQKRTVEKLEKITKKNEKERSI